MIKLNKKHWLFITIIFSVFLVIHTMSFLVTRPWCSIVDLGGDSLKNIYVYLYHSAWGKGYWFDGMNYPYGEHIVFSDGFPLLSVFFATFHHVTPQVALTFMWWLIGLSYVLEII